MLKRYLWDDLAQVKAIVDLLQFSKNAFLYPSVKDPFIRNVSIVEVNRLETKKNVQLECVI